MFTGKCRCSSHSSRNIGTNDVQKAVEPFFSTGSSAVKQKAGGLFFQPADSVQRKCAECEKEENKMIQQKANGPVTATPSLASRINNSTGHGKPLPAKTLNEMGSSFGTDFSGVKIHTEENAAQMNNELNAQAFTHGKDIYFNKGKYNPETSEGKHLLAHELTHVVQQQNDVAPMVSRASWGEKWDAFWSAGPIDSYRANELAQEALAAAQQTGLPGLHNGPADAWRHCYWNCRMVEVIGKEDAEDIAENHEEHGGGPVVENTMDKWNNEEGRKCSGGCDNCCQSKLDAGKLWVLYGGKLGASKPTPRKGTPNGSKYDNY